MKNNKSCKVTEFAKHEFDLLLPMEREFVEVNRALVHEARIVQELSDVSIPGEAASISRVEDVICSNADNIFVFRKNDEIVGLYAMLMLRSVGLERLLLGEFDGVNPDLISLSRTGETPAAIYVWSYVAPGLAADGVRYVSQFLQQPKYRNINFFARPVTKEGVRITLNFGYEPIETVGGGLYRYVRLVNREPKLQRAA